MRPTHAVLLVVVPVIVTLSFFGYKNLEKGEEVRFLNTIPKECEELRMPFERAQCLSPYFKTLTQKVSAEAALLRAQELEKEGVIDDCHLSAHEIGQANFEIHQNNIGEAFATCPLGCIEGCFHGVMEKYIEVEGNVGLVIDTVANVCAQAHEDSLLQRQCVHGIGHGLLQHATSDITQVIAQCRAMDGDFYQYTCLGGVFMENMNGYLSLSEEMLIKELPTICGAVEGELLSLCLESVGEGLMFYTGHDEKSSKKFCTHLDSIHHASCIRGVEGEAATHARNSLAQ